MKVLLLLAAITLMQPNLHSLDVANDQMIKNYNVARTTALNVLTPQHRELLGTIAARLATSTNADYIKAAKELDLVLSPTEKHAIITAYTVDHDKMRAIMQNVGRASFHDTTVLHIGSPPSSGSTAGATLLYLALNLGPATMNAMIIAR
jgi:hypothetical protein